MSGDEMQRKLQREVDSMLASLDKERLRPLQKNTYLKMATCLDNTSASQDQVQRCLEHQQIFLQNAQQVMQGEMGKFQERLQRCAQTCQDEVSHELTPNMDRASPKFLGIEKKVNACMGTCVERHIDLLQSAIFPKIKADIDNIISQQK